MKTSRAVQARDVLRSDRAGKAPKARGRRMGMQMRKPAGGQRPVCQNATAAAAATFSESTPRAMGMRTV